MKLRIKRRIITDWYVLPQWGKGLAIGAIIGSILMIPLAFLTNISPKYVYIPFAALIISCLTGLILAKTIKFKKK
jgi:hypothetical protein